MKKNKNYFFIGLIFSFIFIFSQVIDAKKSEKFIPGRVRIVFKDTISNDGLKILEVNGKKKLSIGQPLFAMAPRHPF